MLLGWHENSGKTGHVALIFGAGLIGGAVSEVLLSLTNARRIWLPYNWSSSSERAVQRETIEIEAGYMLGPNRDANRFIDVIWAAGRSGFSSSQDQMAVETKLFLEILDISHRLFLRFPAAQHSFHMMSSAGGLFEGRVHCDDQSSPAPLRPYGEGKLQQEDALRGTLEETVYRIYRPASVYGFRPTGRAGLITTLIGNGLRHKVSRIFGTMHTIRDYVHADDIGRFVAQQVLKPVKISQVLLLASGRPTTTFELIQYVEKTLRQKLFLEFDPRPHNARDMSFRSSSMPRDWRPMSLELGVRRTMQSMQTVFLTRENRRSKGLA